MRTFAIASLLAFILIACGSSSSSGGSSSDHGVDVVATCPTAAACGGDPTGSWDILHGCAEQSGTACSTGGSGTVKGRFSITPGAGGQVGSYSLDLDTTVNACGQSDSSGSGGGGSVTLSGSTMTFAGGAGVYSFCVQGDTLTLISADAKSPKMKILTMKRSVGDGGTDAH